MEGGAESVLYGTKIMGNTAGFKFGSLFKQAVGELISSTQAEYKWEQSGYNFSKNLML